MERSQRNIDLDGLRLIALGRIPRCASCPRYRALVAQHTLDAPTAEAMPTVPGFCHHEVCAPLVARCLADPRQFHAVLEAEAC